MRPVIGTGVVVRYISIIRVGSILAVGAIIEDILRHVRLIVLLKRKIFWVWLADDIPWRRKKRGLSEDSQGSEVLKQPAALYDGLGSWRRITSCALTKVMVSGYFYAQEEGFQSASALPTVVQVN